MVSRHGIMTVDPYLTNLSIEYGNRPDSFIASQLFPIIDAQKKRTGTYRKWGKGRFREYEDIIPRMGQANQISIIPDDPGTFALVDRGLQEGVPDKDRTEFMSQGIDMQEIIMRYLTDAVLVNRERRVAAYLTSASYLTNYSALTGDDRWDKYTSVDSNPFEDIETMRASIHEANGTEMNVVAMGRSVYRALKMHPLVIDRIKNTMAATGRNITPQLLAAAFDVPKVIVGDSQYITTKEGQTSTLGYIWGNNVIGAHINPAVTNFTQTLGFIPSFYGVGSREVMRWRPDGVAGEMFRVGVDEDEVLVDAECGYLLQTVVS